MKPDPITLGTIFYQVSKEGEIHQLVVIKLPFEDDPKNFWNLSLAVTTAIE